MERPSKLVIFHLATFMDIKKMKEIVCVFCKKNELSGEDYVLTYEHIIPKVLGGWLTVPFVCKTCNNKTFGSNFEADLKSNGFIVAAIDKLNLQERKNAYRAADLSLLFPTKTKKLKAYFDKNGDAQFYPQELEDKSLLIPEKDAKQVLSKKIKRYESENKIKVDFNLDDYESFPYNIVIPVFGSDICFLKTRGEKASLIFENLSKPISFKLPAKIALVLLSGIDYSLTISKELDPFRDWTLSEGENTFILLNSYLKGRNPLDINYLPNHFVRYTYFSESLVAIIGIFGIFKFSVFLGKIKSLASPALEFLLDKYIVFDLENKEVFLREGDAETLNKDKIFTESIARWGLMMNKLKNE